MSQKKTLAEREAELQAKFDALEAKERELAEKEANLNSPKGNHVTDEERVAKFLSYPVLTAGESADGRSKIDPLSADMEPVKYVIKGGKSFYYVMARQDYEKGKPDSPNYSKTAYLKIFPAKIPTGQEAVAPYIRKKGVHVMRTLPFFHFEGNLSAMLTELRAIQMLFSISDEEMGDLNEHYEAIKGNVSK